MTDKVQKIKEQANIDISNLRKAIEQGFITEFGKGKLEALEGIVDFINYLQEEPVSEDLNTESMIESYKQRLISQANGIKNSSLIDMCLASYKHGINEALDTLNLFNVKRIVKDLQEEPKPKFKVGDRIKFKGIHNEDVTRVITNIQKDDGSGFRYFFADGSIVGDDIELVEETVNEDLELKEEISGKHEYIKPNIEVR